MCVVSNLGQLPHPRKLPPINYQSVNLIVSGRRFASISARMTRALDPPHRKCRATQQRKAVYSGREQPHLAKPRLGDLGVGLDLHTKGPADPRVVVSHTTARRLQQKRGAERRRTSSASIGSPSSSCPSAPLSCVGRPPPQFAHVTPDRALLAHLGNAP